MLILTSKMKLERVVHIRVGIMRKLHRRSSLPYYYDACFASGPQQKSYLEFWRSPPEPNFSNAALTSIDRLHESVYLKYMVAEFIAQINRVRRIYSFKCNIVLKWKVYCTTESNTKEMPLLAQWTNVSLLSFSELAPAQYTLQSYNF
jgi:hypothetical protein